MFLIIPISYLQCQVTIDNRNIACTYCAELKMAFLWDNHEPFRVPLSASLTSLASVFSREVGTRNLGFKIFRFPESLCWDPRKCLYISKDFSGADIYHPYTKNALVLRYCKLKFFLLAINYLLKFAKFFKTKCL